MLKAILRIFYKQPDWLDCLNIDCLIGFAIYHLTDLTLCNWSKSQLFNN